MTFRDAVQKSPEVKFAMAVFHALNSNNFVRFFRLVRYQIPSPSHMYITGICLAYCSYTYVVHNLLFLINVFFLLHLEIRNTLVLAYYIDTLHR